MEAEALKVYTIDYILKNEAGEVVESTHENQPFSFIHGNGDVIPGLEAVMVGKEPGDSFQAIIEPGDAYGEHDPAHVHEVPKSEFDQIPDLQVGMSLQARTHHGIQVFIITKIADDTVTVDGNHMMAGQKLFFDIDVREMRDATDDDLAPKHQHGGCCGGGGHHDHDSCNHHEEKDEDHECCGGHGHGHGGGCKNH